MTYKVGDILLNEWASEDNPARISLIYKKAGRYVFCWYLNDSTNGRRLDTCRFYANELKENKDNKYHIIGHCDYIARIREALTQAKQKEGDNNEHTD